MDERMAAAQTWLITGCSSGLGRHLAETILANGGNAIVTARDPATVADFATRYPDTALPVALDIDREETVQRAVADAAARFGPIDILINNAGYSYRAAVEEGEDGEIEALFQTNVFGALKMIKAVLPAMRARRAGTIVNISSIAGQLSIPGSGYYSATKFALEGLSEALRKEVAPLGIHVLIVEPGALRTDFSGRSLRSARVAIDDYAETVGPRRKENDRSDGTQPGDPAKAARAIWDIVHAIDMPARLLLGRDAVGIITAELSARLTEIERWAAVSTGIDF